MRLAQHCLLILIAFVCLSCLLAAQVGALGFFTAFSQPFTTHGYWTMVVEQSFAPALILVMAGLMARKLHRRCKLPRWFLFIGLGAICVGLYTIGYVSHDFSHVLFQECSGAYGSVIRWTYGLLGLAQLLIYTLDAPLHSPARPLRFQRWQHMLGLAGAWALFLVLEMASTKYSTLDKLLNPQIPLLVRLSGGYSGLVFFTQFIVLPVCYGLFLYGFFHLIRYWAAAMSGPKP